jgi:hypothetical protein
MPVDQSAHQEARSREHAERTCRALTDEEGHVWRVREVSYADAAPSLIFECECGFRRVRKYPKDWRSLSDSELYELSWRI